MTRLPLVILALLPLSSVAADDGRVTFLEQEVRQLHRQVLALTRQVEALQSLVARPDAPTPLPDTGRSRAAGGTPAWIDAGKWKRIRPGLSELEVIELLGPPTTMREENGQRILFYALEIGASGFLGGGVVLRDRAVIEVRPPTLQ